VALDRRRAAELGPLVGSVVAATGLTTPPLVALAADLATPPPATTVLTAREAEVASLAAAGLANREIAEQLVVSLRTVENHLHRAFTKLGVTSRAELAVHLAPD
jgi:DNA-binding NarL/FixJ family response regulator